MDEPTNGLDPNIANQMYKMLDKLKKDNKLTILIVSHDIDRALKYADRVIRVESGKLVFNGNTKDYVNGGDIK